MKHRFNPSQARDKAGRWTAGRRIAAVPYARASLRSQTAGINAGANITRNYRVSVGGYARIERRTSNKVESALTSANNKVIEGVAKKLAPDARLEPLVESGVRKAQRIAIRKVTGGQHQVGQNATVRVGTTRTGLPSVVVRKGSHRVSDKKRNAGIDRYAARMEGIRVARAAAKAPRPQRRGKKAA
jgi:hypothetical protein